MHLRLPVWNQWRQMAAPLAEVEDSLLLRGLVQALVVVGVATDIAAETQLSYGLCRSV